MSRYHGDQNKVVGLHESGTYGVPSGTFWIGLVNNLAVNDTEGYIETRSMGNPSRSFHSLQQGPRDVTGTLTFYPQDFRLLAWAIGSVISTSGLNQAHIAVQIDNDVRQSPYTSGVYNAPLSFALEDSKAGIGTGKNFVRTIKGCVINSVSLNIPNSDRVTMDVDWIGQSSTFGSGTPTTVSSLSTRPYLWNDVVLTVDGSVIQTAKDITFSINENAVGPHYINGSRDIATPFYGNRDVTLNFTMDAETETAKILYDKLYRGGSIFNTTLNLTQTDAVGSAIAIIAMSGCFLQTLTLPSPSEGINEMTIECKAPIVIGSFFDRVIYQPF